MKKVITVGIAAATALTMISCGTKTQSDDTATEAETPKTLVLYYSQTGTTQAVAEQLAAQLGADIEAIEIEQPYSGDFNETVMRCVKESQDSVIPAVKPIKADLNQYDTVFLGYPIWMGTYARPIMGLVETYDFAGKKVVPFCTFGSGGLEVSAADLAQALPNAEILEGYGVRTARVDAAPAEIEYFLITNGYIEGEVEALPEYSEQQPVTDAETAIFDAACGDYQFPLGTPVTVGKRSTPKSTDYKYTVKSKGMDGTDTENVIYVTVSNDEGAKPEFTKVVR